MVRWGGRNRQALGFVYGARPKAALGDVVGTHRLHACTAEQVLSGGLRTAQWLLGRLERDDDGLDVWAGCTRHSVNSSAIDQDPQ